MPFNFTAPANWLYDKFNPPPTGLFQTRVTHTPGGFAPQQPGVIGSYSAARDPRQWALSSPDLSPAEQQQLAQLWTPLGKGGITFQPGVTVTNDAGINQIDPITIKHEQIHALQHNAGLDQYAGQIAPLIDPGTVESLKNDPVYQKEMQNIGVIPTIASEGAAYQLTQMPYAATTQRLQDEIMSHLKNSIQQKQLRQLSAPRDQSQK